MIGSELLILNICVRMIGGHFVTVIPLGDIELLIIKLPPITHKFIFNINIKVNNNNGVTMKFQ